jgi:hypothetical protein
MGGFFMSGERQEGRYYMARNEIPEDQPITQPKDKKETLTDYVIKKFKEAGIHVEKVEPPKDWCRRFLSGKCPFEGHG